MMTIRIAKTITSSLFALLIFTACSTTKQPTQVVNQEVGNELSQQNVDAAVWFHTSAENYYLFEQTYNYATLLLQQRLSTANSDGRPPAVVLDIDETVLDNSPYMLSLIQKGETFTEESWEQWVDQANASVLPGVKRFLQFCEDNGVAIYYISNRSIKHLDATVTNMQNKGLPNADPAHVLLKEQDSDKTSRRMQVLGEANVLIYIGDNLRDFDEMFKERNNNYGRDIVKNETDAMLSKFVILPNPMYGQWQSIFNFEAGASEADRAKAKAIQAQPQDYR